MEKKKKKAFNCTKPGCDVRFTAEVEQYEAPMCPKCKDSEWVELKERLYYEMD